MQVKQWVSRYHGSTNSRHHTSQNTSQQNVSYGQPQVLLVSRPNSPIPLTSTLPKLTITSPKRIPSPDKTVILKSSESHKSSASHKTNQSSKSTAGVKSLSGSSKVKNLKDQPDHIIISKIGDQTQCTRALKSPSASKSSRRSGRTSDVSGSPLPNLSGALSNNGGLFNMGLMASMPLVQPTTPVQNDSYFSEEHCGDVYRDISSKIDHYMHQPATRESLFDSPAVQKYIKSPVVTGTSSNNRGADHH
jgi:hypothetical protein